MVITVAQGVELEKFYRKQIGKNVPMIFHGGAAKGSCKILGVSFASNPYLIDVMMEINDPALEKAVAGGSLRGGAGLEFGEFTER